MKNIIVTGGTGFIGKALAQGLRSRLGIDANVFALGSSELNLEDTQATFDWFATLTKKLRIDHIFHLAALYKAGGWPIAHPATQFFANMMINVNALNAWTRYCPDAKFVGVLSYCMYPPHDAPHPESELWGTEPEEYLYSYAATKKMLLIGQKACAQEYGSRCTSVVLPTVYGPGGGFSEDSHVMGALIGKFVRAVRAKSPRVEVWGDGSQEREFIYIDDAVQGIIEVGARAEGQVHNLGVGETSTVRRIAETIAEASGFTGQIDFNSDRFVGVIKRQLDSSAVKRDIGWSAKISIAEGIRRTVAWYRDACAREESETHAQP